MHMPNVETGTLAATEISKKIIDLIKSGVQPADIAIATTGVGIAMLSEHFGPESAGEISYGLIEKARLGELPLYPALKAANTNEVPDS